jgi:hypothetical protein
MEIKEQKKTRNKNKKGRTPETKHRSAVKTA